MSSNSYSSGSADPLAEWSQKIKTLQQQVDDDGLQEQARLEAEIAKSRLERAKRRSTLTGNARVDQAAASYLSKLPDDIPTRDKQEAQADALLKLTGTQKVDTPPSQPEPSNRNTVPTSKPVSLAEFMGGSATGPRLNKPASQSDYQEHERDYESRIRNGSVPLLQRMARPPPVALHGLSNEAPKKDTAASFERKEPPKSTSKKPVLERFKGSDTPSKKPEGTTPQRAASIPSPHAFTRNGNSSSPSTIPSGRSSSSSGISTSGTNNAVTSPQSIKSPAPITARWTAAVNSSPKSPPPSSPSPSTPQLKRPVQPNPTPVQHFVPSINPSPAFLKVQPEKEERPSITRLQGRGFVERQVMVSAKLSSPPKETPKPQRPTSSDRKLTVLQRWPGDGGANSPNTTPEKSVPPRRDFARSLPPTSVRPSEVVAAQGTSKPTRTRNFEHDSTPLRLPGMNGAGSLPTKSSTLPQARTESETPTAQSRDITYHSPMRLPGLTTESSTSTVLRKSSSGSNLRQLGRRRSAHFDDEMTAPSTVPLDGNQTDVANTKKLTHLTRDRAKKPRKPASHTMVSQTHEDLASSPVEQPAKPKEETPSPRQGVTKEEEKVRLDAQKKNPSTDAETSYSLSKTRPSSIIERGPVPATPLSSTVHRGKSGEKAKFPPPIVSPKPVALRRNSLPFPAETTSSGLFRHPDGNGLRDESQPANLETLSKVSGVPTVARRQSPPSQQQDVAPSSAPAINVKAAVFAWGQQSQERKKPEQERPRSSHGPTVALSAPTTSENEDMNDQKHRGESPEPSIVVPPVLNPPTIPMPQPRPRPGAQSPEERRRSINQRYSSIILPPLKEEKTPAATPEGSLKIAPATVNKDVLSAQAIHQSLATEVNVASKDKDKEETLEQEGLSVNIEVPKENGYSPISPMDRIVSIPHEDLPIPSFNLSRLLSSIPATPKALAGSIISVEAFVISGSVSTAIKDNLHILYDSEIVAIVYRGKNKSTGLVATTIWAWIGAKASVGEKEEAKLQDLASRFNTSLIKVPQGKEPFDFVQIIGGTVAIRHGVRSHWSPENTALHCVRSHGSHFIVIEEVELMAKNICSAFTYCLAILDALFIWHGKGSTAAERQAAGTYARSIAAQGVNPTEIEEGIGDEMFWMMLDEGDYANADFWKFRGHGPIIPPRLWAITDGALQPVVPFCATDLDGDRVLLYDGIFELFVIVGQLARARREDIRLALAAAESLASASALTRTFPPPVHVLVFPTRVPVDLRANFRLMDYHEAAKPLPEHINLLTLVEAQDQLNRTEWKLRDLRDPNFLPLAISPSMQPDFTS